ncbi:unnamed protein product [Symbiodinium sp. CCMP2592]|nr:unnamed protein product [Symbiodinium sp. CCMP2592]
MEVEPAQGEQQRQKILSLFFAKRAEPEKLQKLVVTLQFAAKNARPLSTLDNQPPLAPILDECVREIRLAVDFPLPPDEGEREAPALSLLDQEIAKIAEKTAAGDPDVVQHSLVFLRHPIALTFVKVVPTAKHHGQGYEYLVCMADVWRILDMSVSYYAWFGKNLHKGLFSEASQRWEVSMRHLVRTDTYKGEHESVYMLPGVKHDCSSSLGLLLVFAMLTVIRGLSLETQKNIIGFLRKIFSLVKMDCLALLPDCSLQVQEGCVSIKKFFKKFGADATRILNKRWESALALGHSRSNYRGKVAIADVWFFMFRLQPEEALQCIPIERVQKRLLHILAQAVERSCADGSIKLHTSPGLSEDMDGQSPYSSGNASRTANLVREQLLTRFLARGSGFITGMQNKDNKDIVPDKLPGTKSRNLQGVAADQFVTAYFASSATLLLERLQKQVFRHLTWYEDASSVATHNVLTIHCSCDGLIITCPLSLLPALKTTKETTIQENLETVEALGDLASQNPKSLRKNLCKDEKVSTRQKMLALNHSLHQLVRFRLSDALPARKLRPVKEGETRHYVQKDGLKRAYLWHAQTKAATWQSTDHVGFDSCLRLSCLQDEGDTSMAVQMANHGLSIMIHRDSMHKLHREECLAAQDVPEVALSKKQVLLIMKYDKAPWKTSAFGRRLREARELVEAIPCTHRLVQMVAPGILHDLGMDPASPLEAVKDVLVKYAKGHLGTGSDHSSGRWADYVDSFGRLRKEWHLRLFFMLYADVLEGKNPLHCLAARTDDDKALGPQVIKVLLRPLSFAYGKSAFHVLRPFRTFQATEVQVEKTPEGAARMKRYIALEWPNLVLSIMQSALDRHHLEDIVWNVDPEDVPSLLNVHFKHTVATLRRLAEFGLLYGSFPWRFFLVCDSDDHVAARTLKEMKDEWTFLLRQEEAAPNAHGSFPLSQVIWLRWRVYREVMTFAEERDFRLCEEVRQLIKAYQASPSSTLGCEDAFRSLRKAERKKGGGEAAPSQLQAQAVKACSERFGGDGGFQVAEVAPSQIHSIPVKQTVKASVYTAARSTGPETGLSFFSGMVREATVSPYFLTRKCINLWNMFKRKEGDLSDAWLAELSRPGQVLNAGRDYWLVVESFDGGREMVAVVPTNECYLQDVSPPKLEDSNVCGAVPVLQGGKMVLRLGTPTPLMNHALQNYASRLSFNCLRQLCSFCNVRPKSTKKSCAEAVLAHLAYTKEQMDEILRTFKSKGKEEEAEDEEDAVQEGEPVLGVDTVCEAKILSKLLQKLEETEAQETPNKSGMPEKAAQEAAGHGPSEQEPAEPAPAETKRPSPATASGGVVPWTEADRGVHDRPDVAKEKIPDRCRLAMHTPDNASPFIQGHLPADETWRGRSSTSRAFRPLSSEQTVQGRATRTYDSALAEVLEFLWSWHEAKTHSSADLAASSTAVDHPKGDGVPDPSPASEAPRKKRKVS